MSEATTIEWVSAGITFLAVVVALFAAKIERLWHGWPVLKLKRDYVEILPADGENKVLVILCLENSGRGRANDAEVFVHKVESVESAGVLDLVLHFVPMSLRWAHSEGAASEAFISISPKMQRYIILGALKQENARRSVDDITRTYFELWTEHKRIKQANELDPGRYRLTVLLGSQEASAKPSHIHLTVPTEFIPANMEARIFQ